MASSFEHLRDRFLAGELSFQANRLTCHVAPLQAEDVEDGEWMSSADRACRVEVGRAALAAGEVGVVILAGGMATRFQYDRPKALYPILEDRTFLDVKLDWCLQQWPELPVHIMTSFHTNEAIAADLSKSGRGPGVHVFQQGRLPRIRPDGSLLGSDAGLEGHATPGHGEWLQAFRDAGLMSGFLSRGGKVLCFSNVDNLGATLDPFVIGSHLQSGAEMTVEVALKAPGDKGGAPARVDGRVRLVEGFMFPPEFDQDRIPYFNTASYCFDATSLDRYIPLPWYVVEKDVLGERVIQFEQLAGDLSATLRTGLVQVNRDSRFIPVKSQADVPHAQTLVRLKQQSEGLS
jgi:UTP--glucose-1-phosphate uridylyltransferase